MSRFLPSVVVADTLKSLDFPVDKFKADFAKVLKSGIKRLYNFQNGDGGWGWYSNDGSATFMSAYVVYGLSRAAKAGCKVKESVIKRGVDFLKKRLETERDKNLVAYTLFALATAGTYLTEECERLASNGKELSPYARALLALALHTAGKKESALKVVTDLEKDRIVEGEKVHFETKDWFYKWENVSVETNAYALKAFLTIKPNSDITTGIVKWLLSKREGNKWHTTKDTAAAIFALIEFVRIRGGRLDMVAKAVRTGKDTGKKPELLRRIRVRVNGKHQKEIMLDLNNPIESRFRCYFTADELKIGENYITFDYDTDGMPSDIGCFATLRYTIPKEELEPEKNGIGIKTAYSKPLDEWSLGDEIEVTVEITADEDYDYIVVNSPIPAGTTVVRGSHSGVLAAFESRHTEALLFIDRMPAGKHRYSYRIKCNYAGKYIVLPPSVTLMYNTRINGRGENKTVIIKK